MTISNFISILRVLLLVPIFQGLSQNTPAGTAWALFYMTLAVISDFLDGWLAKRLNQVTDLGKVLDPIADKLCLIGVTIMLTLPMRSNPMPFWFLVVLIVRDTSVVITGYILYKQRGYVSASNIWGKSTSTIIAVLLMTYVLNIKPDSPWLFWLQQGFLLWLAPSFLMVSMLSYGRRFYDVMWGTKKEFTRTSLMQTDQARSNKSDPQPYNTEELK
ncbi:CDP-alcohol phosphatidyltransferase family protein [bacterium]|nr:CDP-alcohol phosphatidyltransferase family protein [bacterium]MBU1880591.1 CDP-alcohol phosphatidyltransferase family protein [bacterium]